MRIINDALALDYIIRNDYTRLRRTKKYLPSQIIFRLAQEYCVSEGKVKSVNFGISVSFCITGMRESAEVSIRSRRFKTSTLEPPQLKPSESIRTLPLPQPQKRTKSELPNEGRECGGKS